MDRKDLKKSRQRFTSSSSLGSDSSFVTAWDLSPTSEELPYISPLSIVRPPKEISSYGWDIGYQSRYFLCSNGIRLHYTEIFSETSTQTTISSYQHIFLLHGSSTWSYLFRKVIPILLSKYSSDPYNSKPLHILALDLPGFGLSDHIATASDITYPLLLQCTLEFLNAKYSCRVSGDDHLSPSRQKQFSEITIAAHGWASFIVAGILAKTSSTKDILIKNLLLINPSCEIVPDVTYTLLKCLISSLFHGIIRPSMIVSIGIHGYFPDISGYDSPYPNATHRYAFTSIPGLTPLPILSDPFILSLRRLFPWLNSIPLLRYFLHWGDDLRMILEESKLQLSHWCVGSRKLVVLVSERDQWGGLGSWWADTMNGDLVVIPESCKIFYYFSFSLFLSFLLIFFLFLFIKILIILPYFLFF